jgi:hypothetical protein
MIVPVINLTVSSSDICSTIIKDCLMEQCSTWFRVEPYPHNMWRITFKKEHEDTVAKFVRTLILTNPLATVAYGKGVVKL